MQESFAPFVIIENSEVAGEPDLLLAEFRQDRPDCFLHLKDVVIILAEKDKDRPLRETDLIFSVVELVQIVKQTR